MNLGAPPDPLAAPIAGTRPALPWAMALVRGSLAFLTVALVGQVVAFAMGLVRGGFATATIAKLGGLYALAFHRVPLEIGGSTFAGYRVSFAFLTGTAFAVWVVYRQGRAVGRLFDGGDRRSALAGAAIGSTYAVGFVLLALVARLDLGAGSALLGPTGISLQPSVAQAFVLPLLLAAGAGAAGAQVESLPSDSWARAAMVGGWRMFCVALGLALVGLLVLATVRPAGLAAYARVAMGHGLGTDGLLLGHQALLLPNQALFVLVPSMGGCVGLHGATFWDPIVCSGHLPRLEDGYIPLYRNTSGLNVRFPSLSRSMPIGYGLFVLVPLIATTWVGRAMRSPARASRPWIGVVVGAGVIFAACVGVGSWLAEVTVTDLSAPQPAGVTLGVRIMPTVLIALAWGVGGAAIGGLLTRRQDAEEPDVPLPSPTSV